VVGHNLKIAWNLRRMYSLKGKDEYRALATKIAGLMPKAGGDPQRGGWYDVVERVLGPGEKFHRFAWHDRKAWWQQEQGILAYLILHVRDAQGCVFSEGGHVGHVCLALSVDVITSEIEILDPEGSDGPVFLPMKRLIAGMEAKRDGYWLFGREGSIVAVGTPF
jgi:hypothetical protein